MRFETAYMALSCGVFIVIGVLNGELLLGAAFAVGTLYGFWLASLAEERRRGGGQSNPTDLRLHLAPVEHRPANSKNLGVLGWPRGLRRQPAELEPHWGAWVRVPPPAPTEVAA